MENSVTLFNEVGLFVLNTRIRGVHEKFPVTRPNKVQIYSLLPAPVHSSVFVFIIRNFIIVIPRILLG